MKKIKGKMQQLYAININYGCYLALLEGISAVLGQRSRLGKYFFYRKHEATKQYLCKKYKAIIDKYREEEYCESVVDFNRIWFFWWQGEQSMPEVVKLCYQSLHNYYDQSNIFLITQENVHNYIDIPDSILKKVNNRNFTLTIFSDYIRLSLLSKYGGIWLDSTILLTNALNEDDNAYFFSINYGNPAMAYHVCMGKWMTSLIGVGQNTGIEFCQELFEVYFLTENTHLTYLLLDCVLALAYEIFPSFKVSIDRVKIENTQVGRLDQLLKGSSDRELSTILEVQSIHKLSYKSIYNKRNYEYLKRIVERSNE
ncbi:capsular polysaccharide synthesis protein [Streptococcus suis]|uniref:capsular polysaccharide synthesis protein n=1 Tax=Streptococcus suis TaxID=1307 RepID=UPI002FC80881